ncbi:hypothetical protein COW36_03160 [bacterium (Candidatus Blackallbacteria) CG17_big_fil_post_rev_8_21_14_2_50_48_46]|uniref:histidine kinase n=1 Tax=bacterium (Candidatus Blackallbacteria) CG17_big_fil_post_rev_8_21_14_2_50_48_46 TaxID=2014261 RepID=A0A2M7G9Q9_9BACT|nr:MAG: hypothetical protein COW64_08665 [bacterium (Candidatus Blackallbacteria) CG18_big_fil_WC_8_21_14_2_50_49_26]PIW18855.1 MAG: hypothetical protein COW36_03160 [bacterium (Candidatus Blackallbacteria) CG17_big_fil_post_rev_8_21_14_2_50_48_46]PIW44846.1 MAG: hypothetical protein COW20_22555 [bacterium (Candidatus Blackallbacteria) CG13_big_fil_rev_8_21_14_2_50_49_14]
MREIEINTPVKLDNVQSRLIDLHSALNVLTVIANELNILDLLAGSPPGLERSLKHIQTLKNVFLEDQKALKECEAHLSLAHQEILSDISDFLSTHPDLKTEVDLPLLERNLASLFKILTIRFQELKQRQNDPLQWGEMPIATLRDNLIHVFEAMELNSHGRYHIVYDPKEKQTNDYLIEIEIESPDAPQIKLPLVLQDIMRDLSANARKYSEPGGRVLAQLKQTEHGLCLKVTDQGMGIPEAELEQIVAFGQRASNARERRTMGGGFGLTKAWYFTQRLEGRMWLASGPGEGTCVRIEIPHPTQGDKR